MTLIQLLLLALIQGLTEFLPISSSAHLILLPELTGWEDQGALIDVAVHVGSLAAVMIYLRHDVIQLVGGVRDLGQRKDSFEARLALFLVLASIPVLAAGFALAKLDLIDAMRSAEVIGWATIVFAGVIYVSDTVGKRFKSLEKMTLRGALYIGLAQVLALIPGTSRSGITMAAGRFLGYERSEAVRFSFLLSIPTISAAGLFASLELAEAGLGALRLQALIAAALSFVAAYIAIWLFMTWVNRIGFAPFALYRLILGTGLLVYVYGFSA